MLSFSLGDLIIWRFHVAQDLKSYNNTKRSDTENTLGELKNVFYCKGIRVHGRRQSGFEHEG